MVNLAGIFGNNSIGYWHKLGKVDRALRHRSKSLLGAAFKNRRHYNLNKDNKFLEIIWGTPDQDRLNRCFSQIAYGIYYPKSMKKGRPTTAQTTRRYKLVSEPANDTSSP